MTRAVAYPGRARRALDLLICFFNSSYLAVCRAFDSVQCLLKIYKCAASRTLRFANSSFYLIILNIFKYVYLFSPVMLLAAAALVKEVSMGLSW